MNVQLEENLQQIKSSSNAAAATASPAKATSDKNPTRRSIFLHLGSVFAITLAVTLLFHFLAEPPRRALCFDARQYLANTQQICEFILSVYKGQADFSLLTSKSFVEAILTDGPVFPGFFGTIFSLLGHAPTIGDWRLLQVMQSVMHAASASMVAMLAWRFSDRAKIGVLSGLTWGLYPAAIFWSGVFYTETTVVFFVLSFLTLFSQRSHKLLSSVACGVAAGAIVLLKPALVPAAVLSCLFMYGNKKTFLAVALGAILTVAPWAVYTKFTTGQARFTAYRNPSFNLAMGADTEIDGCYVWPGAPLTSLFASEECSIAFPLSQWQYHTGDCLRMSARKIACLLGAQSNDFRQSYFGIAPKWLNLGHQTLVFFGFLGLFLFVFGGFLKQDSWHRRIGLSLFVFVAGHLTYILFTPTSRYGFTAIPMLCVFLGYAVSCLLHKDRLPGTKGLILSAAALTLWYPLLLWGETWARQSEPKEVSHTLGAGDSVLKVIDLTGLRPPKSTAQVLLLIDGDDGSADAEVSLNGRLLAQKPVHLRNFSTRVYDRCWDLRSLGYPMGISQDQFRQWKAVVLEPSLLKWGQQNLVTLSRRSGTFTVYSDKDPNSRQMLSPDYCSVNNVSNSVVDLDPRIVSRIPTAQIKQRSMLHRSGAHVLSDLKDCLRVKLCVLFDTPATAQTSSTDSSANNGAFSYDFKPSDFDLYMQDKSVEGIRTNRHVLKSVQRSGAVVELPAAGQGSHVRVRITGMVRSVTAPTGKAGVVVALLPGRGGASLTLAATPDHINATTIWRPFSIDDTLPVELLGQGKRSLYVGVYPGTWLDICGYGASKQSSDLQLKNIHAEVNYTCLPNISHGRTIYY